MKLKIRTFNSFGLNELLGNISFWQAKIIPITKQRIISQINNPFAEEKDTLLIVAYDNDDIVGYIGLLPTIFKKDHITYKYFWGTTWWINSEYTKTGVGIYLLMSAFEESKNRFAAIAFTESAKVVYANYRELGRIKEQKGFDFQFFYDIDYLNKQEKTIKKTIKKIVLPIKNLLSYKKLQKWSNGNNESNFKLEYVNYIDEEILNFIKFNQKNEISLKNNVFLEWILKYPWVLQGTLTEELKSKYYFTSIERTFSFLYLKVSDISGNVIGFLVMRLRDNHLTVPYLYYETKYIGEIVTIIWQHIYNLKIKTFTTYRTEIHQYIIEKQLPFIKINYFLRYYVLSKEIENNISNYNLQDGDGDAIFT